MCVYNELFDTPDHYDALEVQGVKDIDGINCEVDNAHPDFFSVYAHLREGGVECVRDFPSVVEARLWAASLGNRLMFPVYDYTT